ncbi:MAG: gfo/Idh/MocA family oxidoreductase [Candidatus Heimdallarchaeota archaeon]|nr:gfo/Idh/MocA family oxidoreductase [Candidatus Heimdallarchaeota archaeon]
MARKTIQPVTAILIGAGTRGRDAYGSYALANPNRLKFIAVADSDEKKRVIFQRQHQIPDEMVFTSWETILDPKVGKIARVAFICTPDRVHFEPAMKALELNYDLMLEKPIAPTLEECRSIAQLAKEKGRLVQICHVLRYTEFWQKVKEIVDSGKLGEIIHYDHSENVAYWHFGHSFVRGAYKNKETSSAIVIAKTCHDLDLIYWLLDEKAEEVSSIGELTYYKPEHAPKEAPERCTDGCPIANDCPWHAPRLYLDLEPVLRTGLSSHSLFLRVLTKLMLKSKAIRKIVGLFNKDIRRINNWDIFPINAITTDYSREGIMKALKETPYGLCIYKAGNDVPDHQISTFSFPSGATATLTMHGLSEHEGREFRMFGSKGVLRGIFRNSEESIKFTDFRSGREQIVHQTGLSTETHRGGDRRLMDAFTSALLENRSEEEELSLTNIFSAMESHFMGFAAEESRITKQNIKIDEFR